MEREIVLLAHNIRSLWNVGSLFRTCDAFGVKKLCLTGYTATPPRREISKTALGSEEYVAWEYHRDSLNVINELRNGGYTIVALEQTDDAQTLSQFDAHEKMCLVVGHEVTGVPKEILELCDAKVQIPMKGKKESLNVAVAAGVAMYSLTIT
ncbi:RNA methyltransferase [Patescibacteria group bacterium]|nr:RNA methyltransferase [Patescibacteria group bacterium]